VALTPLPFGRGARGEGAKLETVDDTMIFFFLVRRDNAREEAIA